MNQEIFRGGATGQLKSGVFTGAGKTHTRPARTLFVTNVPNHVQSEDLEKVFEKDQGYERVRMVRRMCFVDYEKVSQATAGMRKHQNFEFPVPEGQKLPNGRGIMVDYDKDAVEKRNRNYEQMRKEEEFERLKKELIAYRCAACGYIVMSLANLKALEDHPRRRADGSHAVVENTFVRLLKVTDSGTAYVRRVASEGEGASKHDLFERQSRLACCSCGSWIAYRSSRSKYLYILEGSLERNTDGGVWGGKKHVVLSEGKGSEGGSGGGGVGYGQMDEDEDDDMEGAYRP